jgi:hypothetical protein
MWGKPGDINGVEIAGLLDCQLEVLGSIENGLGPSDNDGHGSMAPPMAAFELLLQLCGSGV